MAGLDLARPVLADACPGRPARPLVHRGGLAVLADAGLLGLPDERRALLEQSARPA